MMFEFLQVITFVLSIIINGNLVFMSHGSYCYGGSSYNRSSCGDDDYGLRIQPPFWISSGFGNPDDAGFCKPYPGFEVRCEGTKPVMNISNHRYYIQGMDSQSITLKDVDVDGEECPRPRHNFSLQSQPFLNYYSGFLRTMFYNCTTIAPQQQNQTSGSVGEIPCLENSYNNKTRYSYAFQTDVDYETRRQMVNSAAYPIPEGFHDWYNYCEESVAASQGPYNLRWSNPVDCDDCGVSGGQCSANDTTGGGFRCQCKDGKTVENDICPEQGVQAPQGAPAPQSVQEAPQGTQARQ